MIGRQLAAPDMTGPLPAERIDRRIFSLRGQNVMLSGDLAVLYGVEPRALVQAVKRNIVRFPRDFMFQLSRAEVANLKSQIVTSSWGGVRQRPRSWPSKRRCALWPGCRGWFLRG